MLEAKNLEKFYREKQVVKKVSLQVKSNQIVGLLGSNGAGKTTTFYMVMGLIAPSHGQVFLNGVDITKKPIHKRARIFFHFCTKMLFQKKVFVKYFM